MPIDNQTANRGYRLPAAGNDLSYDIARIVAALQAIDADMAQALVVAGTVALLNSPAFIGTPSAPTAVTGTNTTQLATTAFVQAALNALVSAAPGALDTLNELAAALGDDPNFATTVTNLIATKAPLVHTHDDRYPLIGRTITAGAGLTGGGDLSANRTLAFANMAEATIKGRNAGSGAGAPTDLTIAQLVAMLGGSLPAGIIVPTFSIAAPGGWLLCNGQNVSRATYAALFAAIGTVGGVGDGATTFGIPDLRGRTVFGKDDMGGSPASRLTSAISGLDGATLGAVGGDQRMQAHTHTSLVASGTNSAFTDTDTPKVISGQTGSTGAGNSQNIPPGIVANWIIYAGA